MRSSLPLLLYSGTICVGVWCTRVEVGLGRNAPSVPAELTKSLLIGKSRQ